MSKVVQFVSKEKLKTERMIKEARALYESVFPTEQEKTGENTRNGNNNNS